jgi:hypothetical protein
MSIKSDAAKKAWDAFQLLNEKLENASRHPNRPAPDGLYEELDRLKRAWIAAERAANDEYAALMRDMAADLAINIEPEPVSPDFDPDDDPADDENKQRLAHERADWLDQSNSCAW